MLRSPDAGRGQGFDSECSHGQHRRTVLARRMHNRPATLAVASTLALTGLLVGCAQLPGAVQATAGTTPVVAAPTHMAAAPTANRSGAARPGAVATTSAGTPPAAGASPAQPPFASVIKDARRIDGPLTLWQKDDKVWIELLPSQFGQPFLLSPKIKSGIGQAWVLGGLMAYPVNGAGGPQVVEFVRVHNQVRLQARNTDITAPAGSPEARAVADAYSHSLLGAVAVASQPHPERKSVLVEANGLFLSDLQGIGMMLQRGLRQGYALDGRNSVITAVRGSTEATVIETENHYYTGNVALASTAAPPGAPAPMMPRFLPDARSMLVGLHYSLAPLPKEPMLPRRADPRVGLFTTTVLDFGNDLQASPRQRWVNRWRLEKKDATAELSEPVKPITFWIDRNVPLAYRETVRAAILEWNKPFEKVGFRQAIVVQQQPDDAPFDTLDFGYASVRWMMNADPQFGAIGPSHVDPRTGEILDADIAFEGTQTRRARQERTQLLGGGDAGTAAAPPAFAAPFELPGGNPDRHDHRLCRAGALAAEQLGYALDVLEARDELAPDSPIAQQFVLDYVKQVIMHEVGHALGLRHNFRASRAYTEAQLSDPDFTRAHGTAASVMEYSAVNLPAPGRDGGMPFQTALGPYDYWAIEYAYKPMPAGSEAEAERIELQRIAARSSEPLLAFGTDEDNAFGIDPETIQLDLGSDPIAFASKRLEIARDLFMRQETRTLSPQRDYAVLRRSLAYAIADVTRAVATLARQIGGVRTLRDFPGSGREPLQPVDAAVQRQALDLIAGAVLASGRLEISPALQRRLVPDFLEREEFSLPTDYAVPQRLLELQRAVLGYLMSDTIAARILDSVGKFDRPADAFQLSELYARLNGEVWSELGRPQAIAAPRRELQREHVNRLAAALLRPSPQARADARALARVQARELLTRLESSLRRHGALDAETAAHLADAADTLRLALAAPIQRLAL